MCRSDAIYVAGQTLGVRWSIRRLNPADLLRVELSVVWSTEGKGDSELHVHHFACHSGGELTQMDVAQEQTFVCGLPPSPLSYAGHLIELSWSVRLRAYLADGREIVQRSSFELVATGSTADSAALETADDPAASPIATRPTASLT